MFERPPQFLEFVWMPSFSRTVAGVLDDEEIRALEQELHLSPRAGTVLAGMGGARKVRVAAKGQGKRGSVRVIYYFDEPCEQIYLLLIYPKNVQATLTPEQNRRIRRLVEVLKSQDCYGNER